jgi:hypothetical protein
MDGKGFSEVRDCFAGLVEEAEEHIPLGLDLDLCLMIDEESVDSLLDREETSSTLLAQEKEKAFVWGVDINYDDDDEEGERGAGKRISRLFQDFGERFDPGVVAYFECGIP